MRRETSAGLKAGLIEGFIYSILYPLTDVQRTLQHNVTDIYLAWAPSGRSISYNFVLLIFAGEIFLGLTAAGAVEGLIFSKLFRRIHIQSIYSKTLVFFTCVWVVINIVGGAYFGKVYALDFVRQIIAATAFAYLFKRWTAKATLNSAYQTAFDSHLGQTEI